MFENGQEFYGKGFGADSSRVCQVVFNTSMAGYQEILTDCSAYGQFVCMAYPLIGNYGLAAEDYETQTPRIGGLIVKEYNDSLANFRAAKTLSEEMEDHGIPGIEGIDTRHMIRFIKQQGIQRAYLCSASTPSEQAVETIQNTPVAETPVSQVSCKKPWYWRAAGKRFTVAVIDCGVKHSILKQLVHQNCNLIILPYNTSAEKVLSLAPDGLLLSSGPGTPQQAVSVVQLVQQLQGRLPLLGIGLGHQIVALANGAQVVPMKVGHWGGNHPVKKLADGSIGIVSQGHLYVVDANSISRTKMQVSHINLIDNTIEGLIIPDEQVLTTQFNPEGSPGPQDSLAIFSQFIQMMESNQKGGAAYA